MRSPGETRPAVFFDRDGTLIRDVGYVCEPDQVELLAGAVEAIRKLRAKGFAAVVVTNQSGIARGIFDEGDFQATQARVEELLARRGVYLDGVYMCPHHPGFTGPCECRKPGTALFERAASELALDLARSFFVGDQMRDVIAAEKLGGTPILVATGHDAAERPPHVPFLPDVKAAAEYILERIGGE